MNEKYWVATLDGDAAFLGPCGLEWESGFSTSGIREPVLLKFCCEASLGDRTFCLVRKVRRGYGAGSGDLGTGWDARSGLTAYCAVDADVFRDRTSGGRVDACDYFDITAFQV